MQEFEEIDIKDIFFILKKSYKFILALVILSTLTSFIVSAYFIDKEYETFTTLMLGKPEDYNSSSSSEAINYQDILTNQKLISTYAEIAKSKVVLNEVKNELDFDISTVELVDMTNISLLKNTEIIKINVKFTDPAKASIIANTLAEVFIKRVSSIMKINNVNIIDLAEVPQRAVSPNIKLNVLIAGVLGLMIGIFIIFMIEMFDNTVKTPEDIEKYLELPVIGMIPEYK